MVLSRRTGIVLNRRNIGVSDRRVTVLAADGKHEFRARGTQKLASKLAGSLEPLTLVEVTLARGRTLDVVTGSAIIDVYPRIRANIVRLAGAGVVASAADVLIHGRHDERRAFEHVRDAFDLLGKSRTNRELLLAVAYGVWTLLTSLGFRPSVDRLRMPIAARRTIEHFLHGDPAVVRRIRCTVRTARVTVEAALRSVEAASDRPVPAAALLWSLLRSQPRRT